MFELWAALESYNDIFNDYRVKPKPRWATSDLTQQIIECTGTTDMIDYVSAMQFEQTRPLWTQREYEIIYIKKIPAGQKHREAFLVWFHWNKISASLNFHEHRWWVMDWYD